MNITDKAPDFVNELGIKWWLDKSLTDYARKPNVRDISLEDVSVFIIKRPNESMTRVIIQDGKVVFDNSTIEGIAAHLDIMKFAKWEG